MFLCSLKQKKVFYEKEVRKCIRIEIPVFKILSVSFMVTNNVLWFSFCVIIKLNSNELLILKYTSQNYNLEYMSSSFDSYKHTIHFM